VNTSRAPIAATIALEMIGPMPGTQLNATCILLRNRCDPVRQTLDPVVEPSPVSGHVFDHAHHARRQGIWWRNPRRNIEGESPHL
jgi:hypothetical protein